MSNLTIERLNRRRARIRARVSGTAERPRLSVKISLKNVIAQLIDDEAGKTLAFVTTVGTDAKGSLSEKAAWAGEHIAAAAKAKKVKHVVFDRNGRIYHGRLHALAEAARKAGLEF